MGFLPLQLIFIIEEIAFQLLEAKISKNWRNFKFLEIWPMLEKWVRISKIEDAWTFIIIELKPMVENKIDKCESLENRPKFVSVRN